MKEFDAASIRKMRRYRILILLTVVLTGFFTQFHRASSGAIRSDLLQTFSMTSTQFATFSAMYMYPYMIMQLPVGILADKIEVRKIITAGCGIAALGTLIFSQATSFPMLCIGRLLVGMGVSAPVICKDKLLVEWYAPGKVMTVAGACSFFQNFGGVVSQAPLIAIVGVFTWRTTFLGLAIVTVLVGVLAFCCVRNKPSDLGFPSELELQGYVRPVKKRATVGAALKQLAKNRYTWPLLLLAFVEMGAYTMFSGTWGVPYIQEVFGYTSAEAGAYTTYLMIGWCFSVLVISAVSDLIRSRKIPIVILATLACVLWTLMTFASGWIKSANLLGVLCFLFGVTGGLTPMLFATVREVNDPETVGTTLGLINTIGMAAGALYPTVCGALLDKFQLEGFTGAALYQRSFLFMVVLMVIALIATIFVKETRCQNIHLKK